jgi:Xaa-Pro aminopeptidase
MEVERAKKESKISDVRATVDYGSKALAKKYGPKKARIELLYKILHEEGISSVEVPGDFPFYIAGELQKKGIDISLAEGVGKDREIKSGSEIESIMRTQRACEKAMSAAWDAIRRAERKGNTLNITSEQVKTIIEHTLIDYKCRMEDLIVSCSEQSSNPHCVGFGPLLPDAPIVIDIFPYHREERYYADMTRTAVRGMPSPEIKDMYQAVLDAQKVAFNIIRAGVTGEDVHNAVCDLFEERGYGTDRANAKTGFIHSTGHGVGLEIHEPPSLSEGGAELKAGSVVTVEPGLYDPRFGGVRIEDMVVITAKGCQNLTKFPKRLVI